MTAFTFTADKPWLQIPVDNAAPAIRCTIRYQDQPRITAYFTVGLAQGKADWFAPFSLADYAGRTLTIETAAEADFSGLRQTDEHWLPDGENSSLRPRYHFTATRGWNNDPNGLVFFNGEYHLFYQHNPYGTSWGNMHWGHAVSTDLAHWQDLQDVLFPDELGTMYSGSAVVDETNDTGLGDEPRRPTMILIYTAAGGAAPQKVPYTQCIAVSQDGRTFKKYNGNPVVPNYSDYNRDPKAYWDDQHRRWLMAFYVTTPDNHHAVRFMGSDDMRSWHELSILKGSPIATQEKPSDNFLYECPDFFKLPFNGQDVWTVFGANGRYALGDFDGDAFTAAQHTTANAPLANLTGFQGSAYAAQTFFGLPGNRRILIAWLRSPVDATLPFSQSMSIPLELSLKANADGEPRLAFTPVSELDALFDAPVAFPAQTLCERRAVSLGHIGNCCKLELDFHFAPKCTVRMALAGIQVTYDAPTQTLSVNGNNYDWSCADGHLQLVVFIDRASIEILSADGMHYAATAVFTADTDSTVMACGDATATMAANFYSLK